MTAFYHWLWRLIPGNPMVVRIVQGGSRRPRHLWVRMGYLGVLILLVLMGVLSGGGLAEQASMTELAKAGGWVFAVVSYGQVIGVCLLAPLFMAGAINQEHSGETFDILLTTPLSNLQIVLGSLAGRLFFILALIASALPLFSVLLIFGGVPLSAVFVSFALAALVALMVGSVAVTLAVLRRGGRKAVFVFVIAIAGYLVGCYAADHVLRLVQVAGAGSAQAEVRTTFLTPLHPLLVLEASRNQANYVTPPPEALAHLPGPVRFYLGRPLATFTLLSLGLSTALLLFSATQVRRLGEGAQSGATRVLRRWLRIGAREGARRRPPRTVGPNPVAWREANTRGKFAAVIMARWGFALAGLTAAALLLLNYHHGNLPQLTNPAGAQLTQAQTFKSALLTLLLIELAVIVLVAIYMSAGCVSREREDGTLDLMLTTPITPRFYIWGKLRGLIGYLTLLLAVPVLTVAMVCVYTVVGLVNQWPQAQMSYAVPSSAGVATATYPLVLPEAALLLPVMLVPFVALCVAVGMNWSLKARGVVGAIIPAVGIVGGLITVLGLCGQSAADQINFIGPIINAFSPSTNLIMLISPWESVRGFAQAGDDTSGRMLLLMAAAIAAVGYSGIVYAMIAGMVSNFDHTMRRLSGTA